MDVTAKLVAADPIPSTSGTAQYTVAADTVTTMRSVHITNGESTVVHLSMTAAGCRVFDLVPLQPHSVLDWSGSIVMVTGDEIDCWDDGGGVLAVYASGVETT